MGKVIAIPILPLSIDAEALSYEDWERIDTIIQEETEAAVKKGGYGSGHFGHDGRPGKRGGSLPGTLWRRRYDVPGSTKVYRAAKVVYYEDWERDFDDTIERTVKEGISRGREWLGRPPSVYFASNEDDAFSFANLMFDADLIVVAEVEIPDEWDDEMITDVAAIQDFGWESSFRIERDIPPEYIKGFSVGYKVFDPFSFSGGTRYVFFHHYKLDEAKGLTAKDIVNDIKKYQAMTYDKAMEWEQENIEEKSRKLYTPILVIGFTEKEEPVEKGGKGSGHHGHSGRPGKRGGSLPGKGRFSKKGVRARKRSLDDDADPFIKFSEVGVGGREIDVSQDIICERAEEELRMGTGNHDVTLSEFLETFNVTMEFKDGEKYRFQIVEFILDRYADDMTVVGRLSSEDGQVVGRFTRIYDFNLNIMKHEYFSIDKSMQNKGIGSLFFEVCDKAYRKLGIGGIVLNADMSVGKYIWAKMGFKFASDVDRHKMFEAIANFVDDEYYNDALLDVYVDHLASLQNPWEFATFRIRDREVGREAILHKSFDWNGKLSYDDPESIEILEAYYDSI